MPEPDFAALSPLLEPVDLQVRTVLSNGGEPTPFAHFPVAGIASIVIGPERSGGVEVGIVGREGMTGLDIVLGAGQSPHQCYMQIDGHGWRLPAGDLAGLTDSRPAIRNAFLRYAHCFGIQLSTTAFANADYTVEERLARWLLLCGDRTDDGEIKLSHEFLAIMLSVRRPGVTVATHVLEGKGMIKARRTSIQILDRGALEELAGASYGVAEAEYARLF